MRAPRTALLVLALAACPAWADDAPAAPPAPQEPARAAPQDVLVLRDGRRLEGRVVAETDEAVTFRADGSTRLYLRADVEKLERAAPADAPAAGGAAPAAPASPATPAPETTEAPTKKKGAKGAKGAKAGKRAAPEAGATPAPTPGAQGPVTPSGPGELTDAGRHWVDELALRAAVDDPAVRRSIAAALRAMGPAAIPALRAAAERAATPSAGEFLRGVADAMTPRADAPAAPAAGAPAPGARPRDGERPGRGAAERLLAELELRDDQRAPMAEVLGGLERGQMELGRAVRAGAAPEDATAQVEALRKRTIDAARNVLDAGQMQLFETRAGRYFDGLLQRITSGGARRRPE